MHIYPPFTPPQFWRFGLFRINRQGKRRRNVFLDFLPKNGIILIYKLVIQIGLEADFPSRSEEIEVIQFWIPPTPREIRLKKLNVSPTLYCNILPLTVYFIGKLMYWKNHDLIQPFLPLFDTWINIANGRPGTYSVFRHGRIRHLPPPCRRGGVPVHHDPVHGIVANPGNREWEPFPLSFFVFCRNPVHRVMVNWDPPISQYLGQPGGNQKGNHSITASKKQDKNKSGISKQRVCGGGSRSMPQPVVCAAMSILLLHHPYTGI